MNVRPRLLVGSFASSKTGMSNKTKPPTHYETLEVSPRATQGEIKSAYFKLSKQYHPDKNSTEAAIEQFRNISEAYEVLGNYNTRRSYDRSILTRTRYNVPQESAKSQDPKAQYYQAQAALFRQNTKTGSTPIYDFDAWTKAHYGITLERTLRSKIRVAQKEHEKKTQYPAYSGNEDTGYVLLALIMVAALVILGIKDPIDGEPALTIRQRAEIESRKELDTKLEQPLADAVLPK